jgi:hypothetical protein
VSLLSLVIHRSKYPARADGKCDAEQSRSQLQVGSILFGCPLINFKPIAAVARELHQVAFKRFHTPFAFVQLPRHGGRMRLDSMYFYVFLFLNCRVLGNLQYCVFCMHDRQLSLFMTNIVAMGCRGLPRVPSDFWNLQVCTAARMKGSRNII